MGLNPRDTQSRAGDRGRVASAFCAPCPGVSAPIAGIRSRQVPSTAVRSSSAITVDRSRPAIWAWIMSITLLGVVIPGYRERGHPDLKWADAPVLGDPRVLVVSYHALGRDRRPPSPARSPRWRLHTERRTPPFCSRSPGHSPFPYTSSSRRISDSRQPSVRCVAQVTLDPPDRPVCVVGPVGPTSTTSRSFRSGTDRFDTHRNHERRPTRLAA